MRKIIWTFEACYNEAQKYQTRSEWARCSGSSYQKAKEQKWLEACCAHMPKNVMDKGEVVVFGQSFANVAAAQRHFNIKPSGVYSMYADRCGNDRSRTVEMHILCNHWSQASAINNRMIKEGIKEKERIRQEAQIYCGPYTEVKPCKMCGKFFVYVYKSYCKFCSKACEELHIEKEKEKEKERSILYNKKNRKIRRDKAKEKGTYDKRRHIKRVKKTGADFVYGITAKRLAVRDGMRCQICKRKVEPHKGQGWQPRGWSVGHIVAIANGGSHTWDNVQCECVECNSNKGAKNHGQHSFCWAA